MILESAQAHLLDHLGDSLTLVTRALATSKLQRDGDVLPDGAPGEERVGLGTYPTLVLTDVTGSPA